jgi:hypothetical protein
VGYGRRFFFAVARLSARQAAFKPAAARIVWNLIRSIQKINISANAITCNHADRNPDRNERMW